jgi:hypothetical protein
VRKMSSGLNRELQRLSLYLLCGIAHVDLQVLVRAVPI